MVNNDIKNTVTLGCGSGGELYHKLISDIFLPAFDNPYLREMGDSAVCDIGSESIAVTTDSFVVKPRFFPGGDIGRIAVCGTVNDLAMSGAVPKYLTVGMIIEAGFPKEELVRICKSMAEAAEEAGVLLVTGDTKVVEKGCCDGIFINTAGVGQIKENKCPGIGAVCDGDVIIVSGQIAAHGIAVMAARHELDLRPEIKSDAAPLNKLAQAALRVPNGVKVMRDPTRGGVASTLNEWSASCNMSIIIDEEALPLADNVAAACELLGIDPLYCANEGKMLIIAAADRAEEIVDALKKEKYGEDACIIGRVTNKEDGGVYIKTLLGITQHVNMIDDEQLPRIC